MMFIKTLQIFINFMTSIYNLKLFLNERTMITSFLIWSKEDRYIDYIMGQFNVGCDIEG